MQAYGMTDPGLSDLAATATRMEARFRQDPSAHIQDLIAAYDTLGPVFDGDLDSDRDRFPGRGGALMLIQEMRDRERG